ncbi:MAG TPA: hypothetical protein VN328_09710 [Thermodesulfovibrionales bacterium]|nr:hypothetical protein [Thermodesulfovibrionales bacterium]
MNASVRVQQSFWTDEEIAGMSSTAESLLGIKGRRLPNSGGIEKLGILKASVFDSEGKKIWYGDIDIEKAGEGLLTLSAKLGPLYLLDETDGRFLSKTPPARFISQIATVVIEGDRILYSRSLAERLGIIRRSSS